MVPDSSAAEAGLLSDTVLPPGEAHRHVGQCGVCPSVGAAGWGAGGAGTQCFPLQEGLSQRTHKQYMVLKCKIGGQKAPFSLIQWNGISADTDFDKWIGMDQT